jgi:hypothetical protein
VLSMHEQINQVDVKARLPLPPPPPPPQPRTVEPTVTTPEAKSTVPDGLMESLGELQDQELKALLELERQLGIVTHDPVAKRNAAVKLQAQIRRRQATKKVNKLVVEKQTSTAAVKIQARLRGAHARKDHRQKLAVQNQAAATKLQAGFRGFKARSRVRVRKEETNSAATKLQAGFRGHKARRRAKKEKTETASAATKLQAGFRGHAARRRAKKEKTETVSAATKLQAGFRGHRARKIVVKKKQSTQPKLEIRTNLVTSSSDEYPQTASILSPSQVAGLSLRRNSSSHHPSPAFDDDRYRQHVGSGMPDVPSADFGHAGVGGSKKKRKKRKKKKGTRRKNGASKSASVHGRKRSRKHPSPLAANGSVSLFSRGAAPKSPTNTSGATFGSFGSNSRASPRSLHMSLASGQSLRRINAFASPPPPPQQQQQQQQSLTSLYAPVVDWGEVRLVKLDISRDAHSLESLYRPLATPNLLPEAFETLVMKIRVLWRQLCFPTAQRGPLMGRIQVVNKENYTLLVSHMMLLQSAHTQLVGIINKIRHELGEDPVGVGTGAHVSPAAAGTVGGKARPSTNRAKRPAGSMPSALLGSPRRAKIRAGYGRGSQRTDQWATELSIAVAQFKALTPWLQEFKYKGVRYG